MASVHSPRYRQFLERLRAARLAAGLTQAQVARRLGKSQNLKPTMRRVIREKLAREVDDLLGQPAWAARRKKKRKTRAAKKPKSELARLLKGPKRLRARYKGKTYTARARADGKIGFQGVVYDSPSAAAKAVLKRRANGWSFWEVQRAPGDWVKLKELRR